MRRPSTRKGAATLLRLEQLGAGGFFVQHHIKERGEDQGGLFCQRLFEKALPNPSHPTSRCGKKGGRRELFQNQPHHNACAPVGNVGPYRLKSGSPADEGGKKKGRSSLFLFSMPMNMKKKMNPSRLIASFPRPRHSFLEKKKKGLDSESRFLLWERGKIGFLWQFSSLLLRSWGKKGKGKKEGQQFCKNPPILGGRRGGGGERKGRSK